MILLREIKTGANLGIFENEREIEEEYRFKGVNHNLRGRLKKVSRGAQDHTIFKVGDFLIIALYMTEQELIDKNLLLS